MAFQDLVLGVIPLDDGGGPAGGEVVHPAHPGVLVVDQIAVPIAHDNQDIPDRIIGTGFICRASFKATRLVPHRCCMSKTRRLPTPLF